MRKIDYLSGLAAKADPQNAALVVIDVQNDFVADGGFFAQIGADVKSTQRNVIPALQRLIGAARTAGILIIFVKAIYDDEFLSGPMRERNARLNAEMPRCLTGSWGADFYEIRPEPGDLVVIKHRYSGMLNTDLPRILMERKLKSLLIAGVATDTCVESTGRDAYFLDYYVTVVSDCCGAVTEQDHNGALKRFQRDYGEVVSSGDLMATWQPARLQQTA